MSVSFLFLKGMLIGLAIAAPVGPIGVLCIQRSLQEGFKIGLMTGLGAALADGTYGFVAAFGLTTISSLLISQQFWIRLLGGIFLLYLGIKLFLTSPAKMKEKTIAERSSLHAMSTTFLPTLTNPTTILSFIGIFVSLGIGTKTTHYLASFFMVIGILLGSAAWWLFLSAVVAKILHHRLSAEVLQLINRLSGFILIGFGLLAIFSIFLSVKLS
jgi:threonine/homoserine/homoserine lactone efflux protein